jgi:hypothetical protein
MLPCRPEREKGGVFLLNVKSSSAYYVGSLLPEHTKHLLDGGPLYRWASNDDLSLRNETAETSRDGSECKKRELLYS